MANDATRAVNISLEEDWNNASSAGQPRESSFNEKNYLNVRLEPGQDSKELKIRLLPMSPEGGSPFVRVHFHNVEVNKDFGRGNNSGKVYKSFICLSPKYNKDEIVDHATYGNKCPFCELNKEAYERSLKATTPVAKEEAQKISLSYKPKEAVIVRCIERGKENEGVKFWKFNLKFDNSDPYHKILALAKTRKEEGLAAGRDINILDLYNGRDLTLTIKKGNTENQTVIDVIEASFDTPLSNDPNQFNEWINDSKKWQDVFTIKSYDYLRIVSMMEYPWYDNETKQWITKREHDEGVAHANTEAKAKADEADVQINTTIQNMASSTSSQMTNETQVVVDVTAEEEDDDELPF